jgi:hypothetical protein
MVEIARRTQEICAGSGMFKRRTFVLKRLISLPAKVCQKIQRALGFYKFGIRRRKTDCWITA